MFAYGQAATVPNSYSYSKYSVKPYYYEVSNTFNLEEVLDFDLFFYTDYYYQKRLQLNDCKLRANERLFKKTGVRLNSVQMNYVDSIIRCNYSKKPLVSFYEDKIKVQLNSGKNQYMLDFNLDNFDGTVLVGIYKDSKYTVEQVALSNLQNIIRG